MTGQDLLEDTRLSYSSATLLKGCERKYWHYKVNKTPIDSDADKDTTSFIIGKSFHHILEMSEHKKPAKIGALLEECVQKLGLAEDSTGLVHAMVLKYLRLHKKTNLDCVKCEYAINHEDVIGYVDVIFKEKDSDAWWICDLKTAKTFWPTTKARLTQDRQLNLYSYFYKDIAKEFGLNPDAFKGCRYRVTTKSTAKQKKLESYNDYVMRLTDSYIKSYDVIVPKEKMNPEGIFKEHIDLHTKTLAIRSGAETKQNFGYCESYFKPCEYWSQCYGKNFTDCSGELDIIEEI